ncbi:MAG: hypothetical protein HZB37_01505 [Planctomycetes bacterium]|nr:hypothetical protein [Planctomycetota bacterium]
MDGNKEAGKKGGGIAKKARRELEAKTGRKVVAGENFLTFNLHKNILLPWLLLAHLSCRLFSVRY